MVEVRGRWLIFWVAIAQSLNATSVPDAGRGPMRRYSARSLDSLEAGLETGEVRRLPISGRLVSAQNLDNPSPSKFISSNEVVEILMRFSSAVIIIFRRPSEQASINSYRRSNTTPIPH